MDSWIVYENSTECVRDRISSSSLTVPSAEHTQDICANVSNIFLLLINTNYSTSTFHRNGNDAETDRREKKSMTRTICESANEIIIQYINSNNSNAEISNKNQLHLIYKWNKSSIWIVMAVDVPHRRAASDAPSSSGHQILLCYVHAWSPIKIKRLICMYVVNKIATQFSAYAEEKVQTAPTNYKWILWTVF